MINHLERGALPRLIVVFLILSGAGAALAFGVIPAKAACVSHRLKSIGPATDLPSGVRIVDSFTTRRGALQERVIVTHGVASAPSFFLGDRKLRRVSKSELPSRVLTCLKSRGHGAGGSSRARSCSVEVKAVWSECFVVGGERTCTYVVEISDCGKFSHYEVW